jgi:RecJ-like exonuclease
MKNSKNSIWQVCPMCNGGGTIPDLNYQLLSMIKVESLELFYKNNHDKCKVCNGARIISMVTGRPPKFENQVTQS